MEEVVEPELEARRAACAAGNPAGCAYEATAYEHGWHGVTKDEGRAARLREPLCRGGHAPACTALGWQHILGRGVSTDERGAVELFERACALGDLDGCRALASNYEVGGGVPRDEGRALELWERVCAGRPRVCHQVAVRLFAPSPGSSLTRNPSLALRFAERGCRNGRVESCTLAGGWLLAGEGVDRNVERGRELLALGCEDRDDRACQALAESLEAEDEARALVVYDRACGRKYIPACRAAGRLRGEAPPPVDDPTYLRTQEIRIHPTLPPFEFRLFGGPYGSIGRIEMRAPGSERVSLPWLEDQPVGGGPNRTATPGLVAEDLNFDGYRDLLSVIWAGATGNAGYAVWIYEPRAGRFVPCPGLWGTSNPVPRPSHKVVTTFNRGGMVGLECASRTFRWIDGEAVEVAGVRQEWSDDREVMRRTVYGLEEGHLEAVETVEVTGEALQQVGGCGWVTWPRVEGTEQEAGERRR